MKRFIKKIFIFLLLIIIVYPVFVIFTVEIFGLNQKNIKFKPISSWTSETLNEVLKFKEIDILILGSSHAYRGYDVRLLRSLGICYNMGTTSQTPLQSYYLIKKFIDILNPKYIILDIYFPLFESDGIESSVDIISNYCSLDNYELFFMKPNPIILNTLIYSYYYYYFKTDDLKIKKYSNNMDSFVSGGFVERKIKFYNSNQKFLKRIIKINSTQKKAFENIINLLNKNKIKYIIVHSPITKTEYYSYENTAELNNYFNNKGIYLNFNELNLPLIDNIHFYDRHHLNQYGVFIFNKYLIEFLKNIFYELSNKG